MRNVRRKVIKKGKVIDLEEIRERIKRKKEITSKEEHALAEDKLKNAKLGTITSSSILREKLVSNSEGVHWYMRTLEGVKEIPSRDAIALKRLQQIEQYKKGRKG